MSMSRKAEITLANEKGDVDNPVPPIVESEAAALARMLKQWRAEADISVSRAEEMLGISARTLEGIEQGRGFRYPKLLVLALLSFQMSTAKVKA